MEGSTNPVERPDSWTAIPEQWNDDPTAQLAALHAALKRHRAAPTPDSGQFAQLAFAAAQRLEPAPTSQLRVEVLLQIAWVHYLDFSHDLAIRACEAAVEVARPLAERLPEVWARLALATNLRELCDYFRSLEEFVRALELARALGDPALEGKVLNNLGNWYIEVGLNAEAMATFEHIADFFESTGDTLSAQMALDNAARAALNNRQIARGLACAERAAEVHVGRIENAFDRLWAVQGCVYYCQLLLHAQRTDEAVATARLACILAAASGSEKAKAAAALVQALCDVVVGGGRADVLIELVDRARRERPTSYQEELGVAIEALERIGEFDRALDFQRELLALNRKQKFDAVHRALGRRSPEELAGVARLVDLETVLDRTITDLINASLTQALRAGHDEARIFRVGRLAQLFAAWDGAPDDRVRIVALAGKLLDIGLMVIPDPLLGKPGLSPQEQQLFDEHAEFGAQLLERAHLAVLRPCVPILRYHHERWDGAGPNGLAAEAIPQDARLLALCDALDEMTHVAAGGGASVAVATETLLQDAGARFDPVLTRRFVDWARKQFPSLTSLESQLTVEAAESDLIQLRSRIRRIVDSPPPAIAA